MSSRKSGDQALILYYPDYKISSDDEKKTYQINQQGGRQYVDVRIADGTSTESLIRETYNKLDKVARQTHPVWNAARKFTELEACLTGEAEDAYSFLVDRDYPDAADKTNDNYERLKRHMITYMSDHVLPGNKIHKYISDKIKYEDCKMNDETGRFEKPTKILNRMERLRGYGASMDHNMGQNFMSDDDMKRAFYDIFPSKMTRWLENDQNIDPFDPQNPISAQGIADHMQRYWNLHFQSYDKNDKRKDTKRKRYDDDDTDDDDSTSSSHTDYDDMKKKERNEDENNNGKKNDNRGYGNCPIHHGRYKHGWYNCFLNPYSHKYDAEAGRKFFDTEANNDNAWYRNVYLSRQGVSDQSHDRNGGGRGYDRGREYHGGRGYSGRGYNNGRGSQGRGGGYDNGNSGRGGASHSGHASNNNGNNDGYWIDHPAPTVQYVRPAPPEQYHQVPADHAVQPMVRQRGSQYGQRYGYW